MKSTTITAFYNLAFQNISLLVKSITWWVEKKRVTFHWQGHHDLLFKNKISHIHKLFILKVK